MANESSVQFSDVVQALREQREAALDMVANLNAQIAHLNRVLASQQKATEIQAAEIDRLKAFEPSAPEDPEVVKDRIVSGVSEALDADQEKGRLN